MPAEPVTCASVASLLPAMADGSEPVAASLAATRHVGSCLACQAEVARYRRLTRSLADLRDQPVPIPDGLCDSVLDALDGRPERSKSRRLAYAGAVAAGAAATAVLVARSRRGRLPLAG